jgi:signal transduction histidine kinase
VSTADVAAPRVGLPWLHLAWPEIALTAFVVVNLAAMEFTRGWETLPFHFIYVSVTIAYGLRAWRTGPTLLVILLVSLTTGVMTVNGIQRSSEAVSELLEVPLMSMMFVVMVLHVLSRRRAAATVAALAADRAAALDRERRFFADASHELVTPLTIARGHLEVAPRSETSQSELELRALVLDELQRMEDLVSTLLQLGRIDLDYVPQREPVPVAALLDSLERRWGGVPARRWRFNRVVGGVIAIDRPALEAAVDAVIENAYQHTTAGDEIVVGAGADSDQLAIIVSDSGEGIPVSALPHVAERFYRVDRSRSRRTGGAGLGLSLVQAVVSSHGGELRIESELDVGTTVTFLLPGLEVRGGRPPEEG